MCGRFAQYQGMADYLRELNSEQEVIGGYDNLPIERYNVAPQTNVQLLHAEGGGLTIAAVRWGWAPHWAMKGKMPAPINARAETVASGKFFKQIWPYRALVAADGWYEWVKDETDPKHKQPYFIRLRSGEPMFFAAIGQLPHAGSEIREDDGFVIITADAQGGMLDIHDRRPVVLPADLAREWIDPNTTSQRAEQIVQELGLQSEAFEWYQVSKAVGNVKNTGAALIGPTRQALIDRRRDAPVSCDWREAARSGRSVL
jgi:putative SOS response-associated peptidase YedK